MSLRSKLQRLDGSRLVAAAPESAASSAGADASPSSSESRVEALADLRSRMSAVLARTAAPTTKSRRPIEPVLADHHDEVVDFPFTTEETVDGPLHVRSYTLSAAHRTGRASVLAARSASAAVLSLLALDPKLAACDPKGALYLDTETTGLHGGTGTVAFLVGLAFWSDSGSLVVEQLLVKSFGEEAPMLMRVAERMRSASMIVTYNGKSFDLPLLRTRFTMARKEWPPELPHLDLVHVARRLHKLRGIECRLTTLEREVLGFERVGDVHGSEVSSCYLHFLRTGNPGLLLAVVDHNAWDVVAMAALVGLYGEPFGGSQLGPEDLVGVARTLARAGESAQAFEVASHVVATNPDGKARAHGLRARAEISKARGDRARAMADFESLAASVDEPAVRLELAKLYEHYVKAPADALALVEQGTGEGAPQASKRQRRLVAKVEKASQGQRSLFGEAKRRR